MQAFTSFASEQFWDYYQYLPEHVQQLSDKAFELFKANPKHPGLQFKKVGNKEPVYSVRITDNYRALCLKQGNKLYWFWIGDHSNYEKMISKI